MMDSDLYFSRKCNMTAGTVKLVGTAADDIYQETSALLSDEDAYRRMAAVTNPYGDGHAVARIISVLMSGT